MKALLRNLCARTRGELPPLDASGLFKNLTADLGISPPAARVHMTAPNPLIGKTHHHELEKFIRRNRSHQFFLWQDADIDRFMEEHFSGHRILPVYRQSPYGILKADIFRLAVLYIHGGFYFDLKSQFAGPLSGLEPAPGVLYLVRERNISELRSEFLADHTSGNIIANWFMAALPGLRLIDNILDYIAGEFIRFEALCDAHGLARAVWETTGPRMLTRFFSDTDFTDAVVILDHNDPSLQPRYACRGAWVRSLIHPHYTGMR